MPLFPSPNALRTRVDLSNNEIKMIGSCRGVDENKVFEIVEALDGNGLQLLKNRVVDRFGQEITQEDDRGRLDTDDIDAANSTSYDPNSRGWVAKRDGSLESAVQVGMHTLSSSFGFKRIVWNRATLYDAGSKYQYSVEPASFAEDLETARNAAFHDRRMARLDLLATGIGSAGCMVSADIRGYSYDVFDPAKIWVIHADTITLDNVVSRTDKNDIEDASVVILAMSSTVTGASSKQSYLAFMGRSEMYPLGRMVEYENDGRWFDIPEPGDGGEDYVATGEFTKNPEFGMIANPLTMYQNESGNTSPVEYPIFNWQMDKTADGTSIFPTAGTFLFDVLFDIDVEYSRDIESGGRSARGAWYMQDPKNMGIDGAFSEGESRLKRDQNPLLLSHAASNAKDAVSILHGAINQAGGAFNVPGHKVTQKDDFQVASGFALRILDQPLTQDRVMRYKMNLNQPYENTILSVPL